MKNSVQLMGKVCSVPKIILVKDSVKLASFVMITTDRYRTSVGELVNDIEWHFTSAKGKLAELIEKKVVQDQRSWLKVSCAQGNSYPKLTAR